jgi:dipeptidyl aminopeptidase/acylaminoacyl peptidase
MMRPCPIRSTSTTISPCPGCPVCACRRTDRASWSRSAGATEPQRLTRSAPGESDAAFLPDGSLVFVSARPDPDAAPDAPTDDKPPAALWRLPAGGGEAALLVAPPGGVAGLHVARTSGTVAFLAALHPSAADFAGDADREKARKDAGVTAQLYESYPIRHWDHYLGPRDLRIFAAEPPAAQDDGLGDLTDLTGSSGTGLLEPGFDIAPDGSWVVTTWHRSTVGAVGEDLLIIDRATGTRRPIAEGTGFAADPAVSPDGRWIAVMRGDDGSPDVAMSAWLAIFDVATGAERRVAARFDGWPQHPVWTPDGSAILFTADDHGVVPVYRLDVADDRLTRLASDGAYSDLAISPDGATVYALRSTLLRPPHVVRLDARDADQTGVELSSPARSEAEMPRQGVLERISARADDGVTIESWLLRPADASAADPAPLVVFVHGGPLGSWAGWAWRWNANLLVERGYAVLQPDPAISLGYGQAFIQRGWGTWGDRPYTDVLAAVDGALTRPDLDASRTALMGGSFGGYMANWVAGHTDRFRAIVTHASLWDLRGFHGTTDDGTSWEQEMGDPYVDPSRYEEHSPSASLANITTPMLVIHGEADARVPISEALRLWTDLMRHDVTAKFLYYPDENHWVLKPQNARLWYATVLAFLDEHVLDRDWVRPELL